MPLVTPEQQTKGSTFPKGLYVICRLVAKIDYILQYRKLQVLLETLLFYTKYWHPSCLMEMGARDVMVSFQYNHILFNYL